GVDAPAVDVEPQAVRERVATRPAVRCRLGGTDPVVTVAVDRGPRLEGRDLGPVDDVVDDDAVGPGAETGGVVDREVAERMCGRERGRRHDDGDGEAGEHGDTAGGRHHDVGGGTATPRRAANASASSWYRNENQGFRPSAREISSRARSGCPA